MGSLSWLSGRHVIRWPANGCFRLDSLESSKSLDPSYLATEAIASGMAIARGALELTSVVSVMFVANFRDNNS